MVSGMMPSKTSAFCELSEAGRTLASWVVVGTTVSRTELMVVIAARRSLPTVPMYQA